MLQYQGVIKVEIKARSKGYQRILKSLPDFLLRNLRASALGGKK